MKSSGGLIGAILGIPVLFLSIFTTITAIVPSGDSNLQSLYQRIAQKDSYNPLTKTSTLNWGDVYMYDYFTNHNDFSSVTNATIEASTQLFIYYITITKKVPVYIKGQLDHYNTYTYKVPQSRTLLDVMMQHGYTMDDYDMALSIENDILGNSDLPVGDVTVPQLRYQVIDPSLLYNYVHSRESLFTLQDMKDMESAAKQYDVNPALLLAITGQECSFDPSWIDHAEERHNNPWDVFHSYTDYNTSFADSANIAANTLRHKLSVPPPAGEDAIEWCNDPKNPWGAYAEDPHWAYGVEDIFANIEAYIGTPLQSSQTQNKTLAAH